MKPSTDPGPIQLYLGGSNHDRECAWVTDVSIRVKARTGLGRPIHLPLKKFRLGPRQRVRHVDISDVTEKSAIVTWSDDSKDCINSYRVRSIGKAKNFECIYLRERSMHDYTSRFPFVY